jgi:hypothetical protein
MKSLHAASMRSRMASIGSRDSSSASTTSVMQPLPSTPRRSSGPRF